MSLPPHRGVWSSPSSQLGTTSKPGPSGPGQVDGEGRFSKREWLRPGQAEPLRGMRTIVERVGGPGPSTAASGASATDSISETLSHSHHGWLVGTGAVLDSPATARARWPTICSGPHSRSSLALDLGTKLRIEPEFRLPTESCLNGKRPRLCPGGACVASRSSCVQQGQAPSAQESLTWRIGGFHLHFHAQECLVAEPGRAVIRRAHSEEAQAWSSRLRALERDIRASLADRKDQPRPFAWRKAADENPRQGHGSMPPL